MCQPLFSGLPSICALFFDIGTLDIGHWTLGYLILRQLPNHEPHSSLQEDLHRLGPRRVGIGGGFPFHWLLSSPFCCVRVTL